MSSSVTQIGGNHYTKLPIQPYEFCYKNGLDYLQSNIIKYVVRFRDKDGIKDLDKAIHTLQVLKEFEYGGGCNAENTPTGHRD